MCVNNFHRVITRKWNGQELNPLHLNHNASQIQKPTVCSFVLPFLQTFIHIFYSFRREVATQAVNLYGGAQSDCPACVRHLRLRHYLPLIPGAGTVVKRKRTLLCTVHRQLTAGIQVLELVAKQHQAHNAPTMQWLNIMCNPDSSFTCNI